MKGFHDILHFSNVAFAYNLLAARGKFLAFKHYLRPEVTFISGSELKHYLHELVY